MKKGAKKKTGYESVKLKQEIVDRVRANKDLTGVSISAFFEIAAEEKLSGQLREILVKTPYSAAMSEMLLNDTKKKRNVRSKG